MSTIANTELVVLQEEQVRLWDDLELERVSRIAGDDANNALSLQLQDNLFGTEGRLSTEVLHREQGDLNNLGTLNALTQALSDYRIKTDQEINAEQIARQQLGVDLNASISSATASFNHREYKIYEAINGFKAEYYDDHTQLDDRISKYEEMLQDITTDSIQITMDNGDINMGAWTILSQAREWDLEILGKVKGFQDKTVQDVDTALEEFQKTLPVEQGLISKAIEALSGAPIITELSDILNSSVASQRELAQRLAQEEITRAEEMIKLASQQASELANEKQTLADQINLEAQERIDAITREGEVRYNQIVELEDGFTSRFELIETEQSTSLTAFNNYKASTDNSLSNIRNDLNVQTDYNTANTAFTTALDARLSIAEQDADAAKVSAASAITTANTAVTHSTATAERLDALEASLSESDGTEVDVNAFNTLKGIVTNQGNVLSGVAEDVTGLTASVQDLSGNKADVSALNNFFTKAEFETESKRVAAGEVSSFSSSLIIGGTNLVKQSSTPAVSPVNLGEFQVHGIYQLYENTAQIFDKAQLKSAGYISVSFDWEVLDTLDPSGNFVCSLYGEPQTLLSESITVGPGNSKGYSTYSFIVPPSWEEHHTDKLAFIRNGFNGSLSISQLKVEIGSKTTGWSPANEDIDEQLQANATAVSGLSTLVEEIEGQLNVSAVSLEKLEVKVNPPKASGSWKISSSRKTATSASLRSLQIKDDKVLAKRIDDLYASVGDNLAQITESLVAEVTTINGKVTAHTTSLEMLTTEVGDNSATLINQNRTLNGVLAESTIKTDVNGLVRGIGFINDGKRAAFGVAADDFFVEQAGRKPFLVTAGATLNGVTYPAGTWIDVAMIANATIGTAHIQDAAITNAKIGSLDASKITTGTIDAARITVGPSTNFAGGYDPKVAKDSADAAYNLANTANNTASYANNSANAANSQLTLWKYPNTTYIDGGSIYTGTITANQINASVFRSVGTDGSSSYISGGTIRAYYPNGNIAFHIGVS